MHIENLFEDKEIGKLNDMALDEIENAKTCIVGQTMFRPLVLM